MKGPTERFVVLVVRSTFARGGTFKSVLLKASSLCVFLSGGVLLSLIYPVQFPIARMTIRLHKQGIRERGVVVGPVLVGKDQKHEVIQWTGCLNRVQTQALFSPLIPINNVKYSGSFGVRDTTKERQT